MDNNITLYQRCIKHLLSEYASRNTEGTEIKVCFDDEHQCYLVMRVGWSGHYTRIHRCLIHIEIADDLIVIQANNTEDPLDADLIAMGISREKICLGFIPADFRAYAAQQEQRQLDQETAKNPINKTLLSKSLRQKTKAMRPVMS